MDKKFTAFIVGTLTVVAGMYVYDRFVADRVDTPAA